MQIVQKLYIEVSKMTPDMKIENGTFYFNNVKYEIVDGNIKTQEPKKDKIPF